MQAAFNTIKEIIPASDSLDKGTVVVATVKGDIYDLGKNIVAALLENNGYKIVDLGRDVDPEVIVQAIKDNKGGSRRHLFLDDDHNASNRQYYRCYSCSRP